MENIGDQVEKIDGVLVSGLPITTDVDSVDLQETQLHQLSSVERVIDSRDGEYSLIGPMAEVEAMGRLSRLAARDARARPRVRALLFLLYGVPAAIALGLVVANLLLRFIN